MRPGRRRHPALEARILTFGLSAAAALGIVGALARGGERTATAEPTTVVEVRIGGATAGDVDAATREALDAWLVGGADLPPGADLTIVERQPEVVSEPS
ncbi:MAG: hypothetical protein AAF962_17615 [Actinomycetota bacterium]